MTRQRSLAHSIKSSVSAPEDGDGITGQGNSQREPAFFVNSRRLLVCKCDSFLGNKQQNQQNSAREQLGLGLG